MGMFTVRPVNLVEAGAGRHIGFTAENRLDPGLFRLFIKFHQAVHDAVIGHGDRLLPQRGGPLNQSRKAAGAVEQTVFAVDMQMYEGHPPFLLFLVAYRKQIGPEKQQPDADDRQRAD